MKPVPRPMRSPKTERGSSRRVAATFLFFLGLYCLTQSGRFHVIDEYETFFVTESLLDRGTLDISQVGDSDYFFGKRDGLVHISQLSYDYVKDPRDVVKAGDIVKVKVLEVDAPRKRISLTLRLQDSPPPSGRPASRRNP